jgi:carbon-monoxide dehydrogenase medium subunit
MKPAAFDYHRADSVEDALQQLASSQGTVKVIAGGQSLGPMLNMRLATPGTLVDLNDLSELAYVRRAEGWLEIGPLTRHCQLAESPLVHQNCPLLAQAAHTIGHYAIRQRGTLGGSLAHADPAAQLPLVAVTLGAQLELRSVRGQRVVQAEEFFLSAMTTAMANDEILYGVRFPVAPHSLSAFKLFSRRQGDFAMVAVAAQMELEQDRVSRLCVGVGGVDGVPRNLSQHLSAFNGRHPDAAWVTEIVRATELAVQPVDDGRVDVLYRQELTRSLTRQVFISALANAQEGRYV